MPVPNPLAVRISSPVEETIPGRGFYQLEESALYVPIGVGGASRRYFSSLESNNVRLDIDRDGRLMFIEVITPRNQWRVEDSLCIPTWAERGDVRWLGFRTSIPHADIITNKPRGHIEIRFSGAEKVHAVLLAESVYASTDGNGNVVSIFVTDIIDDLAGQEIGRYRQSIASSHVPIRALSPC